MHLFCLSIRMIPSLYLHYDIFRKYETINIEIVFKYGCFSRIDGHYFRLFFFRLSYLDLDDSKNIIENIIDYSSDPSLSGAKVKNS